MAKPSAEKKAKATTPAGKTRAKKVEPLTPTPKAIKKTPTKAAGSKPAAKTTKPNTAKATTTASAATRKKNTDLKPTKSAATTKKTTATTSKTKNAAKGTNAKVKDSATTIADKPVAARDPEKARTVKEKAAEAPEKKTQSAKSSTKSEVAKKLIQSKAAKAKAAGAKSKTSRPISFTLDEALQIAKTSGETGKSSEGNGAESASTPAAAPGKATKEVPAEVKQENRVLGAASISDILGYNPSAGPKKDEASEIPAKFSRYYKLLLELREHVLSGLDIHTRDTLKRSAKEDSGDLSAYSQHMADAGTDTFDRDFALSLVSSEQDALFEIEDAIRRIKKGNYGVCEITGKPIKKERLLAVPFAKFSVEGQAEYERTHRKSAYRGGAFGDSSDDPVQFMDDDSED